MRETRVEFAPARTAALLSAIFLAFGAFWGGFGALAPDIKAAAGATNAEYGRALLFVALGAIAGMSWAGRRADKAGTRGLFPAGLAFAVTIVPLGLTASLPWLSLAFAVLGLTSGILDVFINAAVSVFESAHDRALMGRAHAFFSLGVLLTSPVVGLARQEGAETMIVLVGLAAVMALVSASMPGVALPPPAGLARGVRMSRTLAVLGGLCALAFLIEDGLLSWSALHLEQTLGAGAAIGGLGPASLAASMVVGRSITQVAENRFRARQIIGASGLLGAVGAALFAFASGPLIGLAGVALTGLAISTCAPVVFGSAGRVGGPGAQAGAIARVTTVAYLGFVVGPAMVGGVAGVAGLRIGLMVLSVAALVMAAGSRLIEKPAWPHE